MRSLHHLLSRSGLLLCLALSTSALHAQTVNWGATFQFGSSNTLFYDSMATPIDSVFTWDVGAFLNGFVPTAVNIDQWRTNWVSLGTDTLDTAIPWNFGGDVSVTSSQTDGLLGYIWGYNDPGNMTETVLWTGDASEWTLPTFESVDLPPGLSTVNAVNVIVGSINTDFGGGSGGVITGGGTFSGAPATPWEIQAAHVTVIPEPSTALLGVFGGLALFRRRR